MTTGGKKAKKPKLQQAVMVPGPSGILVFPLGTYDGQRDFERAAKSNQIASALFDWFMRVRKALRHGEGIDSDDPDKIDNFAPGLELARTWLIEALKDEGVNDLIDG